MEERSAILSHGRPQNDVVNWINSERRWGWGGFRTGDRLAELDVLFQPDGPADRRVFLGSTPQSEEIRLHGEILRVLRRISRR